MSADDCKAMKVEKGRRITINVKGDMPLGYFREEVVIKTDHPKQPELKLTVAGKMVGPISASPERVLFKLVHSPQGDTGAVTLTVRGLRPTKFEVERKPEKLEVGITPLRSFLTGGPVPSDRYGPSRHASRGYRRPDRSEDRPSQGG